MSSLGVIPEVTSYDVDESFLPYPATKLIVTQYIKGYEGRPPHWAWIIVGAFYDEDNVCLWSTEVFAAHLDIDPDYEPFQWSSASEESSEAEWEVESETESFEEEQVHAEARREQTQGMWSNIRPLLQMVASISLQSSVGFLMLLISSHNGQFYADY